MNFANIRNNEIIDMNSKYLDEDITRVEVSDEIYQAYVEDRNKVVYQDGEIILNPNYEAELEAKEKARIAEIALTRADVFEALILARGLTKQMLRSFIENDETLNDIEKALYLNRFDDALEFYRKHPAIDFIAQKLDITSESMDKFFDTKDYMYLMPKTDVDTLEEDSNENITNQNDTTA